MEYGGRGKLQTNITNLLLFSMVSFENKTLLNDIQAVLTDHAFLLLFSRQEKQFSSRLFSLFSPVSGRCHSNLFETRVRSGA